MDTAFSTRVGLVRVLLAAAVACGGEVHVQDGAAGATGTVTPPPPDPCADLKACCQAVEKQLMAQAGGTTINLDCEQYDRASKEDCAAAKKTLEDHGDAGLPPECDFR
jgi:hypothetical protein